LTTAVRRVKHIGDFIMKTANKIFAYTIIAAFALLFAACGEPAGIDIAVQSTNTDTRRPAPPDGLRLKSLSVYYQDDAETLNLLKPALSANTGDYTVPDADASQGALAVFAEAQTEELSIKITWKQGTKKGGMTEPQTGSAVFSGVAIPALDGSTITNTLVEITVSNGSKSYVYNVEVKAPGTDSSLDSLWFRYDGGALPDAKYPSLWTTGEENDDNAALFTPAIYDYIIELDDANKAGAKMLVSARAASATSEISLTAGGEDVTPVEAPAAATTIENRFSVNRDDAPTGDEPPTGEPLATGPEDAGEPVAKYWEITIPEAGADVVRLVFTVKNEAVSSLYTVALVPPQISGEGTTEDGRLSNLQFQYFKDSTEGNFVLTDFSPDKTSYTVSGIPQGMTHVKIISLVPVYAGANAAVSYTPEGGETTAVAAGDVKSAKIPLPAVDKTMSVNIKVGAGERLVEYAVEFRNPAASTVWKGTAVLNGDSASGYEITGIEAVTADGAVHQAGFSNPAWSATVSKAQGAPVSFAAALKKTGDTNIYRVTAAAGNMTSSGSNVITFTVKDNDAANPVYLTVINASQLANMGNSENLSKSYYLENNITLDQTSLGKNWDGPDGYKGHFNGNGKTITLELSKGYGATGLFDSLADGAVIENLNVNVSTISGGVEVGASSQSTNHIYFGAVVGSMSDGANCKFKNISVKGELNYKSFGQYTTFVVIGGIFGEVDQSKSPNVTIENCESDLIITAPDISIPNNSNYHSHVSIGALVGKVGNAGGTVKIINCRTGGSITASMSNQNYLLDAGGIIGCASKDETGTKTFSNGAQVNLTIENCYSTTNIDIKRTAATNTSAESEYAKSVIAGGLIGVLSNRNAVIKNNVAVNSSVKAGSTDKNAYSYPVIGFIFKNSADPFKELSGNVAVSDMLLGGSKNFSGATPTEADPNTVANLSGATASPAELLSQGFWTAKGFSTDNWDFTGLSVKAPGTQGSVYPKLKKSVSD
jgi:hypothetical protein